MKSKTSDGFPSSRVWNLYLQLRKKYGDPGPWPWFGSSKAHSPDEIAMGAILTQNTSWRNVEYALSNLRKVGITTLRSLYTISKEQPVKLISSIRPAGFYNQKAQYLSALARFIIEEHGSLKSFFRASSLSLRQNLLSLPGIGSETADTILLYSGNKLFFVIDAYTKRFIRSNRLSRRLDYSHLQKFFMDRLPKSVRVYQDYHALIVQWAKDQRYAKRPKK